MASPGSFIFPPAQSEDSTRYPRFAHHFVGARGVSEFTVRFVSQLNKVRKSFFCPYLVREVNQTENLNSSFPEFTIRVRYRFFCDPVWFECNGSSLSRIFINAPPGCGKPGISFFFLDTGTWKPSTGSSTRPRYSRFAPDTRWHVEAIDRFIDPSSLLPFSHRFPGVPSRPRKKLNPGMWYKPPLPSLPRVTRPGN